MTNLSNEESTSIALAIVLLTIGEAGVAAIVGVGSVEFSFTRRMSTIAGLNGVENNLSRSGVKMDGLVKIVNYYFTAIATPRAIKQKSAFKNNNLKRY